MELIAITRLNLLGGIVILINTTWLLGMTTDALPKR
jgi:hypothetical protein